MLLSSLIPCMNPSIHPSIHPSILVVAAPSWLEEIPLPPQRTAPATASAEPPLGSHDRGDPLALSCGIACTRENRVGKHSGLAGSVLSSALANCTFEDSRRTDRQHVCQTQMCMCTNLGLNRIACTPASWPAHIVCCPLCQIPCSNVRDPEGHLGQEARLVGRASRRRRREHYLCSNHGVVVGRDRGREHGWAYLRPDIGVVSRERGWGPKRRRQV